MEARAINLVFGEHRVAVSSIKATTGHMIGGVGAEVIATIKAMEEGIIPPTLNLHDPITGDLDFVALKARPCSPRTALKLQYGFGGPCVALALQLPESAS